MVNAEKNTQRSITTVLLIHWVLFASIFIYGGLAFAIPTLLDDPITDPTLFRALLITMSVVSLSVIAFVFYVRTSWLSPESLTDVDENEHPEEQYMTAMIVQGALLESIAVYGLMLSMVFSWFWIYVPFALVPIGLMIAYRPSKRDFEQRLERAGWNPAQETPNDPEP